VDPNAIPLNELLKRCEAEMRRDLEHAFYGDAPAPWRPATPDYEMDKKTEEFVKVYAKGRARNKPLKHRP
jgi:hypothetical protein